MSDAQDIERGTLMARMEDGHMAATEAEGALTDIVGVELLGIGWDWYDRSFELYPEDADDLVLTPEQHDKIMALGCMRYWINFKDGTERYCNGERKPSSSNRWEAHNRFKERKRSEERELLAAREDARRYRWLRRGDGKAPADGADWPLITMHLTDEAVWDTEADAAIDAAIAAEAPPAK
jgi:hypothetical protein